MKKDLLVAIFLLSSLFLWGDEPVVITAVGDIMFHNSQLSRAWNPETDSFDFSPSMEPVKRFIETADYAIGNFETTLGGKDGALGKFDDQYFRGYHAYPYFNTPDAIASDLKELGFDILVTANNHSLDSGYDGMVRTLEVLHAAGLHTTGTSSTNVSAKVFSENGIDFVLINYTYGLNTGSVPRERLPMINTLQGYDDTQIQRMNRQIKAFKDSGLFDVVMVSLHFGVEWQNDPTDYQKELVDSIFAHGADIILGGHSHTPQPFEVRTLTDQTGRSRRGFVIYSLGNFLASMPHNASMPYWCDTSIILQLSFEKDGDETVLTDIGFIPIWVQWQGRIIRILPVLEALSESGQQNFNIQDWERNRLQAVYNYLPAHMTSYMEQTPILSDDGIYHIRLNNENTAD